MADQVTEIEAALGRSRAARGESRPPLPRVLDNLPVVEQFAPPGERDRLAALEQTITGPEKRLERLAKLLCTLNFGEMMEHTKGTGAEAQKVWDWSVAYLSQDKKEDTNVVS
jgi:hypothetical protein